MDKHIVPGIEARHAAEAHREDLKIQDQYGCRCMTYWVDEGRGYAFCLIDAPNIESVHEMHRRAHGLIPHEIIQVNSHVVEAFLGRMEDPKGWNDPDDPTLKVFNDPAFRVILVSQTDDPVLVSHKLGKEKAKDLFVLHNDLIREQLSLYEGSEVELEGKGFIASFVSVSQAIQCAISIRKRLHIASELLGFRMGIHAGIPVTRNKDLFGDTINLAQNLCYIGEDNQILWSSIIQELHKSDYRIQNASSVRSFSVSDENFVESVFSVLLESFDNSHFGVIDFAAKMSMSKSKLYRRSKSVIGCSPNEMLRDFRLTSSLRLLKAGRSISQTTYDCGFTSPSYFAKCFQEKFDLQPLSYLKLANDQ